METDPEEPVLTCWPARVLVSAMFGSIAAFIAFLMAPKSFAPAVCLSIGIAFGSAASEVSHPVLLDRKQFCKVNIPTVGPSTSYRLVAADSARDMHLPPLPWRPDLPRLTSSCFTAALYSCFGVLMPNHLLT